MPHTSSQENLYERITQQAEVTPSEITLVDAYGTGTLATPLR